MKTNKETHHRYTQSFKVAAVLLANHPGIQTQDVALALDIHPFMLSRWKKEHRDGVLKGKSVENIKRMEEKVQEQKKLRELEKRIQHLESQNELLKKSIEFTSAPKETSSNS